MSHATFATFLVKIRLNLAGLNKNVFSFINYEKQPFMFVNNTKVDDKVLSLANFLRKNPMDTVGLLSKFLIAMKTLVKVFEPMFLVFK